MNNSTLNVSKGGRINGVEDLLLLIFLNLALLIIILIILHKCSLRNKMLEDKQKEKNFQRFFIDESNIEITENFCSICLEEITDNHKVLTCNHCYHKDCIIKWLNNKEECPNCRKDLTV